MRRVAQSQEGRHFLTWLLLTSCLLLPLTSLGCSLGAVHRLYEGPALPKSEVATIWAKSGVSIKQVGTWGVGTVSGRREAIELLPGRHTVRVRYLAVGVFSGRVTRSMWDKALTFDAEAGHEYVVHANREGDQWHPWIVDEETGRVVSGQTEGGAPIPDNG